MQQILNDTELQSFLLENGKKLVLFSADWCGPCKILKPNLEKVSEEVSDVIIVKADVSETEEHTKRFGIRNIPTCILLENNEEIGRFIGVKTPDQIKNFIQEHQN